MSESGKVVYLLGAGASAASDFKLPTTANFFTADLLEFPALAAFLKSLHFGQDPESHNLEEVMAYLEFSNSRLPAWGYDESSKLSRQEEAHRQCFAYVRHRHQPGGRV